MEAQGFTVYPDEWWHFDYEDWRSYRIANQVFGEIEVIAASFPVQDDRIVSRIYARNSLKRRRGQFYPGLVLSVPFVLVLFFGSRLFTLVSECIGAHAFIG